MHHTRCIYRSEIKLSTSNALVFSLNNTMNFGTNQSGTTPLNHYTSRFLDDRSIMRYRTDWKTMDEWMNLKVTWLPVFLVKELRKNQVKTFIDRSTFAIRLHDQFYFFKFGQDSKLHTAGLVISNFSFFFLTSWIMQPCLVNCCKFWLRKCINILKKMD